MDTLNQLWVRIFLNAGLGFCVLVGAGVCIRIATREYASHRLFLTVFAASLIARAYASFGVAWNIYHSTTRGIPSYSLLDVVIATVATIITLKERCNLEATCCWRKREAVEREQSAMYADFAADQSVSRTERLLERAAVKEMA